MASSMELYFQMTVYHYRTPNKARQFSQTRFILRISTFVEDDNGHLREDHSQRRALPLVFPEFLFGSKRHRNLVASVLLEAGWTNQVGLDRRLDEAFSHANSILEYEKENNRDNNEFGNIISIIFRVKKIVWRNNDDELEVAREIELSMSEDPKLVPATKESIQALEEVKLVDDDNGIECIICMENLESSKTEVVTRMPCSHQFHGDCIEKWLNTSHLSPLCRFPMPTDVVGKV